MSRILTNSIHPRSGNQISIGRVGDTVSIAGTLTYEDVTNVDSVGVITARGGLDVGVGGTVLTTTTSGNIGIGTSSPDLPLVVKKTNAGGTGGAIRLLNNSTTTDSKASLIFTTTTNETFNSARIDGERAATGTNIVFSSSDIERMRIDSSGNVGIGTTNPTYELEVASPDATTVNIKSGGNTNLGRLFFSDDDAIARGFFNYQHDGDNLLMGTSGAEKVRIDGTGSVGIGVTNMDQTSTLYLVGGQGVRWTHPDDGTIYGDHYVNTGGAHVFRSGSSLSTRLVLYDNYMLNGSVKSLSWTDIGAANGVTETLNLMSWNTTNNARIYGEFTIWAGRSGLNQQRGYKKYAVSMTYYSGTYSGFITVTQNTGVTGYSTLVIERSGDNLRLRHVGNVAAGGASMLIEFRGSWANGVSVY